MAPLTLLAQSELEALYQESEAFYAQYPRGGAPAAERKAQVARDIAIANADPETLDITCIAMKNRHSEADDRKLRGSPLACSLENNWDGRAA